MGVASLWVSGVCALSLEEYLVPLVPKQPECLVDLIELLCMYNKILRIQDLVHSLVQLSIFVLLRVDLHIDFSHLC